MNRIKGHAFRPTRNPYNPYRGFFAGCECGEDIAIASVGPVTAKTAKYHHSEHLKAVRRKVDANES